MPSFVSLGMVVLDELRFPNAPTLHDVVGGSGAYSVLGARLAAGKAACRAVGCFVAAGHDFPESVLNVLNSWGVHLCVHRDATRPSTRGLLEYEDSVFGRKTFRYTTEPLQPSPRDMPAALLGSAAFHLLGRPEQIEDQIDSLMQLRRESGDTDRPLLVWEPLPLLCKPHMKDQHLTACGLVDVFSPNHLELAGFFQDTSLPSGERTIELRAIETYARAFLDAGIGSQKAGSIVVRAGEHGCLVASSDGRREWLPPFYDTDENIVDATGAGNTFLGALAFAMTHSGSDVFAAARLASTVTSFALEQIGLPKLAGGGQCEELWNGVDVAARISEYTRKLQQG
ncbi:carbohydrate/purine kinase [Thozetella sp. PMI_491]|nr:carbohydrate/purine kinase [Thozetella sp. PMI_491]